MGANHHFKCKKCKTCGGHMDKGWEDIPEWNQFVIKHIVSCGEDSISIFSSYHWEDAADYEIEGSTKEIDQDILSYTTKELTERTRILATKLQQEYEEQFK